MSRFFETYTGDDDLWEAAFNEAKKMEEENLKVQTCYGCNSRVVLDTRRALANMTGYLQECKCGAELLFPHSKKEKQSYDFESIERENKKKKKRMAEARKEANERIKKSLQGK